MAQPSVRSQLLLDRLRAKSGHLRALPELAKATRSVLLDRRFILDLDERGILQKCLDQLQDKIPVRSAAGMAERLETIGRKIGIKFMAAPGDSCYYLSTEMFYVEIHIDSAGLVSEAKIHHIDATQTNQHPTAQTCPEIIECLSQGDFPSFIRHLDGLVSVYSLNPATAAERSQAWNALSAMERDLGLIYESYKSWSNDPWAVLHQTTCGLVQPRTGGLPMTIRYFLPPYELIDEKTNSLLPASLEAVQAKDLGLYATPTIEISPASCLLPIKPLISLDPQGNVVSQDMDPNNSISLPARFALKLKTPMPLSLDKCRDIEHLTNIAFYNEAEAIPMMQLITRNKTNHLLDTANHRGLFVTLPDQQHCYILSDPPELHGVMVSSIPFTHPNSVPQIIGHLREQALFNTLIESCARVNSIQDLEKSIMFEVSCTDLSHLTITFEHPSDESMATVELDLSNISQISCQMYTSAPVCPEPLANKIVQKCMSIPIIMRSLIRHNQTKIKTSVPDPDTEMPMANFSNGTDSGLFQANGNHGSNSLGAHKYGRDHSNGFHQFTGNAQPGSEEAMEADRGGGNSTGFGTPSTLGEFIKDEPMDFDMDSTSIKTAGSSSLNEYGPQDATFNPEASSSVQNKASTQKSSKSSSSPLSKTNSSGSSSPSTSVKIKAESGSSDGLFLPPQMEGIKQEFSLTKATGHTSETESKIKQPGSLGDFKPLVSITPVTSSTSSSTVSKKSAGGIEIIPLGGPGAQGKESPSSLKNRELMKRSLSEDGKRRLDKKASSSKKRKHPSSSRVSSGDGLSSSKKKLLASPDGKVVKVIPGAAAATKGKLDSVIHRLQNSGPESSIELLPANSKAKLDGASKPKSSSSASLKLTLKTPCKYPSPPGNKEGAVKPKSSTSSPSSKEKSGSSGKHSSSKGSSSHRSSGSSSKDKDRSKSSAAAGGGGSSAGGSSDRKRSSTAEHHRSSSSNRDHGHRSGSSDRDRQREREVKKLLDGGKLNKTFQIPKLSKSSSPSTTGSGNKDGNRLTPTTSPKQSNLAYSSSPSPKYIGGGSVTPPNISPKHPYSAPSSVPGLTRSSPLHTTSPNTTPKGSSRTPSASPTYGNSAARLATGNSLPHTFLTPDKMGLDPNAGQSGDPPPANPGPAKTAKEMEEILDDSTATFLLGK